MNTSGWSRWEKEVAKKLTSKTQPLSNLMNSHVPSKGADGAISPAKDSSPSGKPGVAACSYCVKLAVDICLLEDWVLGRHKLGIH